MSSAPDPVIESPIGRLERNFLALALGDAGARAIAFGATVYLARTLGAELYGVVALAAAVVLYPIVLTDFGIADLGSRDVAHDPDRARTLAPALVTARCAIAAALSLAMAALAFALLPSPEAAVFAGTGLVLLAVGLNTSWILVGLEDARPAGVARLAGALVVLLVTVVAVREPEHVVRAPLAVALGGLVSAGLLLRAARRRGFRIRVRWAPADVRPVVGRALPLLGHSLLGLWIFNSDLVMLRVFQDRASVGIYAAAYALVSLLLNAGGAYSVSLVPALTRLREAERAGALLETAYARAFAVALPAAVGGGLLAPAIVESFFGARYAAAAPALAILLASVPAALLRNVATAGLIARDDAGRLFRISAAAALTATALNLALVPTLGIVGAALATLATDVARAAASVVAVRALGLPGPALARLVAPALAAGAMAMVLVGSAPGSLWGSVPLGVAVYAAVLAALGGVHRAPSGWPTLRV